MDGGMAITVSPEGPGAGAAYGDPVIPEPLSTLLAPVRREVLERLRSHWRWRVRDDYDIVGMTIMGDWLFLDPSGGVFLLETTEATLERIAGDMRELVGLVASDDYRDDTFIEGLALGALAAGPLRQDHCVGFEVPPVLGGELELSNLQEVAVESYQEWTGKLHEALSKVPAGAQVSGVDVGDDGTVSVRWRDPRCVGALEQWTVT